MSKPGARIPLLIDEEKLGSVETEISIEITGPGWLEATTEFTGYYLNINATAVPIEDTVVVTIYKLGGGWRYSITYDIKTDDPPLMAGFPSSSSGTGSSSSGFSAIEPQLVTGTNLESTSNNDDETSPTEPKTPTPTPSQTPSPTPTPTLTPTPTPTSTPIPTPLV